MKSPTRTPRTAALLACAAVLSLGAGMVAAPAQAATPPTPKYQDVLTQSITRAKQEQGLSAKCYYGGEKQDYEQFDYSADFSLTRSRVVMVTKSATSVAEELSTAQGRFRKLPKLNRATADGKWMLAVMAANGKSTATYWRVGSRFPEEGQRGADMLMDPTPSGYSQYYKFHAGTGEQPAYFQIHNGYLTYNQQVKAVVDGTGKDMKVASVSTWYPSYPAQADICTFTYGKVKLPSIGTTPLTTDEVRGDNGEVPLDRDDAELWIDHLRTHAYAGIKANRSKSAASAVLIGAKPELGAVWTARYSTSGSRGTLVLTHKDHPMTVGITGNKNTFFKGSGGVGGGKATLFVGTQSVTSG